MNPVQTDIQRTNAMNAAGLTVPQQNAVVAGKQTAPQTGFQQINLGGMALPSTYNPQTYSGVGGIAATPTPAVSTTTISNTNKMAQIPSIVQKTNQLTDVGVRTDPTSGIATYANGRAVPAKTQEQLDNDAAISEYDRQIQSNIDALQAQTDAETASMIENIKQKYVQRRAEQTEINRQQQNGMTNALLMGGATGAGSSAQYAPISSGGIIGAQESYGLKQIAALDAEEQDLIAAAKAAQASKNFKILDMKNTEIEKKRAEKMKITEELNKQIAETNKKLREQNIQSSRDTAIADLYSQGITDPTQMLNYLNKNNTGTTVGDFTIKEISDTLKNIVPEGLNDLVKTLRTNAAPEDVVQRVLKSGNINEAYKNAGTYAAGGTGIIGEYNFYRAQALGAGQIPLTFSEYQNEDANRKKSIAAAGVAGNIAPQTLTKVQAIANAFDNEPTVKEYNTIATQVDAVKSLGVTPTDDIQRIYAFAKVMDPNSAVREGEYSTIQAYSTALMQRYGLNANRVFNNDGFLTKEARGFLEKTLQNRLDVTAKAYDNVANETARRINKITGGVDGNEYITDYRKGFGTDNTANTLLNYEDAAKQAVIDFGMNNPSVQKAVRDLAGVVQPEMGRAYTWEEIGQLVGAPLPEKKNSNLGDKQSMNTGLELIRKEEGFVPNAYKDSTGTWTIGYGSTMIDGRPVRPGDRVTRQQADEMLASTAQNNYSTYKEKVTVPLNARQNAALMSFEYNLGPSIWDQNAAASIIQNINDGKLKEAAKQMLAFNKSRNPKTGKLETNPVLVARRKREAAHLLTA